MTPSNSIISSISGLNWPLIIGVVVGVIAIAAIVGIVIFIVRKRRMERQSRMLHEEENGIKDIRQKKASTKKEYNNNKKGSR